MSERFLHERVYRGSAAIERLQGTRIALCGLGAVGSNLAMNLARQGAGKLVLIDRDRVEPQNLGTQVWSEAEIGLSKAECLRDRLFDALGVDAQAHFRELNERSAAKLLRDASVVVDSFDNSESRALLASYSARSDLPCLHAGLSADYAEVIWNERYRVPSAAGQDVCDYPLARNLILLSVAVASECLLRFLAAGEKQSYTITLVDFAVRPV